MTAEDQTASQIAQETPLLAEQLTEISERPNFEDSQTERNGADQRREGATSQTKRSWLNKIKNGFRMNLWSAKSNDQKSIRSSVLRRPPGHHVPNFDLGGSDVGTWRQQLLDTSRATQGQTTRWRKLRWADSDKRQFSEQIETLRRSFEELMTLLQLSALGRPQRLLGLPEGQRHDDMTDVLRVEDCFQRAHAALKGLAAGREDWPLSLALMFDFDGNKEALQEEDYLHQMRMAQPSLVSNIVGGPFYHMIETGYINRGESSENLTTAPGLQQLATLDRPAALPPGNPAQPVETWGFISNPDSQRDRHVYFHHTQRQPRLIADLKEVLEDGSYIRRTSPVQVVRLAHVLVLSYMYLGSRGVHSDCGRPHPQHVVFYGDRATPSEQLWKGSAAESEPSEPWDTPAIELPWLRFGFGRRRQRRPRARRGALPKQSVSIYHELAILLYQVGSGEQLSYDANLSAFDCNKLRREISRGLAAAKVDRLSGSGFSDVVQLLLDEPGERGAGQQPRDQLAFLRMLCRKLEDYENELADTLPAEEADPHFATSLPRVEDIGGVSDHRVRDDAQMVQRRASA